MKSQITKKTNFSLFPLYKILFKLNNKSHPLIGRIPCIVTKILNGIYFINYEYLMYFVESLKLRALLLARESMLA